jgi:hypothetical protein
MMGFSFIKRLTSDYGLWEKDGMRCASHLSTIWDKSLLISIIRPPVADFLKSGILPVITGKVSPLTIGEDSQWI